MALDLSGAWELDKERSQSMYPHMKLLGCDEIAALASEKLNLTLHVVQSKKQISTWQQSQLGIVYRGLLIGQDTTEHSSMGERKVFVTAGPKEMTVDSKFRTGRLLDTRSIEVDQETGEPVLVTVLQLTMRGQGGSAKTTRYFKRIGDPDPEVIHAPFETISTSAGVPPEEAILAAQSAKAKAAASANANPKPADAGPPGAAPATQS
mmetsp:Transcript_10507/g.18569  ORF Transcript_10507/g.18569 Transcript_10507/m.18569 type:complete len:207 (-) Transcript_10507:292-912(-)|eukprot:CAMPEP_0184558222 /NCGR_PEP_ID=MMETSP0199_2-20130426/44906_1 /TAXON_ID=1112570 /ORGANISM="Thraustochytrium sp., Strain LLF1b" /LENGTH=206 /DNA_ID=CAMNT_0026955365 /DNA_START=40 /DNA_END=660 /DNA_ORIENTATION=+